MKFIKKLIRTACILFVLGFSVIAADGATATNAVTTADVSTAIKDTVHKANELVKVSCLGLIFFVIGIIKLKQHKENPAQNPLSASLMFILVGAFLLFLPSMIQVASNAVFGTKATPVD